MKLITGDVFDVVIVEEPKGLRIKAENLPIEFEVGFVTLPGGASALQILLPQGQTFRCGSAFFIVNDNLNADKVDLMSVDLAKRFNVHPNTIYYIKSGKIHKWVE